MSSPTDSSGYDYIYGFHLFDDLHNFFPEVLYDDVIFDHDSLAWMRYRMASYFPAAYTRQSNMYRIWQAQRRRAEFDEWRAANLLLHNPTFVRPPSAAGAAAAATTAGAAGAAATSQAQNPFQSQGRPIRSMATPQRIFRSQFLPTADAYLSTLNAALRDLSGASTTNTQRPRHTTMIFSSGLPAAQSDIPTTTFLQNILDLMSLTTFSDVVVAPSQIQIDDASQILRHNQVSAEFICPICQEHAGNTEGETEWRRLACTHTFHRTCIDRWLGEHTQCPMCRADVREMNNT